MTPPPLSDDDIVLAGEAALGLLDRAGEAVVAARIASDTQFAAEVAAWHERFAPLLRGEATPVPTGLWDEIRARTARSPAQRAANSGVRLWQAIAGTATAAAGALTLMILNPPATAPVEGASSRMLVAALASDSGRGAMTASYYADRGELLITPVAMNAGNRFPELWVIDDKGDARSLGFVSAKNATRLRVDEALKTRMSRGMTLAVTLEPDATAPHAKASGPVAVIGKMQLL